MGVLASPTLTELLADVRALLNQSSSTNSFWTDAELTSYLNEAARRYFVEVTEHNEGLFTTTSDSNIVADTEAYALPTDCFEVRAVYKKVSNGYAVLPYKNDFTSDYSTQGGTSSEYYQPYYFFRGNSIILRPTPQFNETAGLRIEYMQFPDTLVNGGDSLTAQISPIFKDLIISYAAYKAKIKESAVNNVNTYQVLKDHVADLYMQFKEAIALRSKYPTFVKAFDPEGGN